MNYDLQKASLLKRFSAWLLDVILLCVLATGCIWLVSGIVNFDDHMQRYTGKFAEYEQQYGISFSLTQEEYGAMTLEEKEVYDSVMTEAETAMNADQEFMQIFMLVVQSILLMVGIGIFLARLILDFLIPLWLRNGQTLGKKVFGLAVMRTNSVRISTVSLFIRSVLGKYTIQTMVPIFIVIMSMMGTLGIVGTIVLFVYLGAQLILIMTTPTRSMIHDKLADTVVVDMASQMIFDSQEDRLAYQQRIATEKAERGLY